MLSCHLYERVSPERLTLYPEHLALPPRAPGSIPRAPGAIPEHQALSLEHRALYPDHLTLSPSSVPEHLVLPHGTVLPPSLCIQVQEVFENRREPLMESRCPSPAPVPTQPLPGTASLPLPRGGGFWGLVSWGVGVGASLVKNSK